VKRARLLRYSPYQLKDYAIERGIMVLVLSALNLIGPITTLHDLPPSARVGGPDSPLAGQVLVIFGSLILLSVLFSSQEIVSRPRKHGFYRLIFSKPVSPTVFYGQLFAVQLAGSVLLLSLMAALFSFFAFPVPIGHIAMATATAFMLFGGVGFLISVFVNHDSVGLIALVGLSILGKGYVSDQTGVLPKLANLLLPVDHLVALKPLVVAGPVASADVVWVIGYGLTALILGLAAVRYTQLAD
jgi:hypothetical protein